MAARAEQAAASLLPRLALWRTAIRAQANKHQPLALHPSMYAPTQGRAASTGLLRASRAAAAATRPFHASASSSSSQGLWSRLVRSSGASSDPLGRALNVTNALIAANLAVALAAASGLAPSLPSALARANWMVRDGEWYRMLTSGFVHSGAVHLLVNAYALHALRDLERLFGGRRYLAIYCLAVVAGNWLGLRRTPAFTVACGASGGVCGVVGAYVAARVANRRVRALTAGDFSWVAQIVGLNLVVQALNSGGGGGSRIDQWGHLGGAVGGAAAALLLGPRLRWSSAGRGLVDAPLLPLLTWRGGRVPPGW